MYLLTVSLAPPAVPPVGLSTEILVDLLWSHTTVADEIEHIRATGGAHGIDVSVFAVAPDPAAAGSRLRQVVQRAIDLNPALSGWRLLPQD
jgi:hypothetical protein